MTTFEPVVPNLPTATRSFTNKYTTGSLAPPQQSAVLQALAQLPLPRPATTQNIINPLALYDATRANRGMSPLTPRQTAAALRTLATGKPATPPRKQGWFRSSLGNLRSLVTSIPHLPSAIINEAREIPNILPKAAEAFSSADNPLEGIGNVAAVPGVRMLPGAFIANQLLGEEGQGVEGLQANPLFTLLDALPLASAAAKSTRVARTAAEAYAGQIEALTAAHVAQGLDASTAILPRRPPRPLQTALTRTLSPTGEVVPNAFGRGIQNVAEDFRSTNTGNAIASTFRERLSSRITAEANTPLQEAMNKNIPVSSLRFNVPGGREAMRAELDILEATRSITDERLPSALKSHGMDPETFWKAIGMDDIPPEQNLLLSPELRSIARDIRDLEDQHARYTDALPGPKSTTTVNIDGTPEVYDYNTGTRVSKAQRMETGAREIVTARQAALANADTPGPLTREQIQSSLDAIPTRLANKEISPSVARDLTNLYETALESSTRPNVLKSVPVFRTLAREYPLVRLVIDQIENGRWGEANKTIRQIANTRYGRSLPLDLDGLQGQISRLIARDRTLRRTANVDEKYLARVTKIRERVENRANPARFDPAIEKIAREGIESRVREVFATSPDLDTYIRLANEGIYDTLIDASPEIARIVREEQSLARESWKALRDAGQDPIFLTRVTPAQVARQAHPRISDKPMTLQAVQKRMMDASPHVKDVEVILKQQALDILTRRATDFALDRIGQSFGRTRASLVAEYTERLLNQPESRIPMKARLARLIERQWTPFNPGEFGGRQKAAVFSPEAADTIYIPRAMADNLRRMYTPKDRSTLTGIFDRPMDAFRTSVLPLALRWQLNNAVSGAIVTAINDPLAFRELPDVIRTMWQERKAMPDAADRSRPLGLPPPGFGSESPDIMRWRAEINANSPYKDRISAIAQYGAGKKVKELAETARADRLSKIKDPARRAIEASYGANQFVDDMWRASMNRSQMKRYLKKGYSEDAAAALAATSIRRIFQAWDEMTPMERSAMRAMVPFYGFASYATRFVLNYPMDHPLRASVLGSLARAELTDAMTGLPEYIREMILLGDPRANGVVRALNVSPFNPFGGVPSMFTVAGFMGQLNPIITGILESAGMDVMRGGPQLYPEMRYDPESGRLVADPAGNAVSNVIGNLVPQISGVTSLLGFNDQFNETLQRDPAAAGRMLMGNFGIPILYRDVNVGEQLIKSEMQRFEDQETARKEALTSGNLGILDDFPGLAAYGEQIRALQSSGQLDQLRPQPGAPGAQSGVGLAYAAQAAL